MLSISILPSKHITVCLRGESVIRLCSIVHLMMDYVYFKLGKDRLTAKWIIQQLLVLTVVYEPIMI